MVNETAEGLRVIEGNTRLFIYKRFQEDGLDGDWDKIPAVVYNDLPQAEIDAIRLQAHLVGPRDWDPYSKGKYLHLLHIDQNMPMSFLEDYCGGRKREVERYIQAYSDMEKFYRPIASDDFDPTRFSAFVELQKPAIINELLDHGKDKNDFSNWVANGKFHRLEDVRVIPRILANEEAFRVFEDEGSSAAILYLQNLSEGNQNLGNASIKELAEAFAQKIRNLNWSEVVQMQQNPEDPKTIALVDAYSEAKTLVEQIEDFS